MTGPTATRLWSADAALAYDAVAARLVPAGGVARTDAIAPAVRRPTMDDRIRRGYSTRTARGLTGDAARLRDHLRAGRLEVHFQPIVSLPDGEVEGFEALARLRRPDGRLVPPARFIGLAESSGLIVPLGLEVLATAATTVARWRRRPALAQAYVSVNVSPLQLADNVFTTAVAEVLTVHGLPTSAIVLELDGTGLAGAAVRRTVAAVQASGVRMALDDFGTGVATLDSLRRLPVGILKLDRSFVHGLGRRDVDALLVRNVLDLASALDLPVVAEGVETAAQATELIAWGCAAAQGWLYGRPMPPDLVASPVPTAGANTAPRDADADAQPPAGRPVPEDPHPAGINRPPRTADPRPADAESDADPGTTGVDDRVDALRALAAAIDPQVGFVALVALLADQARAILGAASLTLRHWDRDHDVVRTRAKVGPDHAAADRFPTDELYALAEHPGLARILHGGAPHFGQKGDADGRRGASRGDDERGDRSGHGGDVGSWAAMRVIADGQPWGELFVTTAPGAPAFGPDDTEALTVAAQLLGDALATGQQLERMAFEDPLTGLANRRAIDEHLLAVLGASDAPVTVVVIDVNGLKQVNDEFGHSTGDRTLRSVADALRSAAADRPDAMCARLGGDEFCVVVPHDDGPGTRAVIDRAAALLRAAPAPQVTISAGAATSDHVGRTVRDLFAAADKTQYRAKHAGRLLAFAGIDDTLPRTPDTPDPAARVDRSVGARAPAAAGRTRPTTGATPVTAICTRVVALLDRLAHAAPADVAESVGEAIAEACDLSRWSFSRIDGDGLIHTVGLRVRRTGPNPHHDETVLPEDEEYRLDDYPLTVAAVEEHTPFWVHIDRDDHDASERELLAVEGMRAVLGIGGHDDDGRWLLELYADEHSHDLEPLLPLAWLVSRSLRDRTPASGDHHPRSGA